MTNQVAWLIGVAIVCISALTGWHLYLRSKRLEEYVVKAAEALKKVKE